MLIPVFHRLIVKQDELETKTASGIIIKHEDRKQESVDTGIVVAIGPTCGKDFGVHELPYSVGDKVAFAKYAGKAIKDPETDEEFLALNDEDIVVVIHGEKKDV